MKLKTLKDLPSYVNGTTVDISLLKQEVIKTIKSVEYLDSWTIPTDDEKMIINAIDWIEHFFNITCEDLKKIWQKEVI